MLVPLFAPVAVSYGIDPLYFVMSGITKVPMGRLVRDALPFVAIQFLALGLCIMFPWLVLALPRALGY